MKRLAPLVLMFGAAMLLTGCTTGPDYARPSIATPEGWRTPAATNTSIATWAWAELYRDPVLTNLIATALANNQDVQIAAARVEEAMGQAGVQRAALFPSVNGTAGFSTARAGNVPPLPGAESEQFNLAGRLSYELDLWGRVRRLNEAARAQLLASEEGRRTVELGLVSGVATAYFNLRALDRQLEIARGTLKSRQNALELTRIKFDDGQGIVSELDVAQAQTQVASTQSSIASLQRQVALAENALSLLLGGNPHAIPRGQSLADQWRPDDLPAGLPSDLLLRRPDLRAAEQQLVAANANLGAARAAYFPSISLTGALGLQSEDLGELFNTGLAKTWSFTPSLTAPIFQAGRIRATERVAEAQRKAAVAGYEKAIRTAFREVDDALISLAHLREQLTADEAVVTAEQRRLDLSTLRYEGGVASYSDVLDAQRFLFSAELTAVQTRNALLAATVQLYRALGGGW